MSYQQSKRISARDLNGGLLDDVVAEFEETATIEQIANRLDVHVGNYTWMTDNGKVLLPQSEVDQRKGLKVVSREIGG